MDYFLPLHPSPPPTFKSSTLLLPQPSLASLPQLAVDLIVHNYALKKVGYLGLRDYVPAVGGIDALEGEDDDSEVKDGVSFAVEVYQDAKGTLTVVLPRSPVIKARKQHHLASLAAFVEAADFGQVLVISSVDAAMRGDESLRQTTPLRHILPHNSNTNPSSPLISTLTSISTPYSLPPPTESTSASSSSSSSSAPPRLPPIPQGGLTRAVLQSLAAATTIPASALLIYTAEGDNLSSAVFLANAVALVLGLSPLDSAKEGNEDGWKKPKSWKRGLLGNEMGREMVGELFG